MESRALLARLTCTMVGNHCDGVMQALQAHLELPRCILGEAALDYQAAAARLQRFTRNWELR